MAKSCDVAAMGNAIVDVLAAVNDGFLRNHGIARDVMTLIDEKRAAELYGAFPAERREVAGGSAANTMAGLASFGGRGTFIGKVRDDRLGHAFADSMRALGIHFPTAFATTGAATACCLIAVAPDGQRSMNTFLGACRELTEDDIDEKNIADAEILYIEGYLWDVDAAKRASLKAFTAARAAGGRTAFSLSDPFCVERFRAEFLELLKGDIDILFANADEAKALFETENFDTAIARLKDWGGIAAVTRGKDGCVVVHGDKVQAIPAAPVAKVIDTTGAGDAFAAGFLFGLTRGKPLSACGRMGALASSEIIAHFGARPEMPLAKLAAKAGLA